MRYQNLDPAHQPPGWGMVLRRGVWERFVRRRGPAPPGRPADSVAPNLSLIHDSSDAPRLTWIGHASILATLADRNVLVDPVFSPRIAWFFPRHAPPGLVPDQLPRIDLLLITHNHYDHLDRASIESLDRQIPVVTPLGLGSWFCRLGFARVLELGWWEMAELAGLRVTGIPARHWSHRRPGDINRSHWCGYVVEGGGSAIYHAGDTAWFDAFPEIGSRFPGLDVALLPIGGCEPRWFMERNHCSPEEAGAAFVQLGARTLVPVHWGTFQLSDESLREPIDRLQAWWRKQAELEAKQLRVLAVGETLAWQPPR
jgi:L-ascorbate metabolism protein UlaG (beta-lactamase superfamily)